MGSRSYSTTTAPQAIQTNEATLHESADHGDHDECPLAPADEVETVVPLSVVLPPGAVAVAWNEDRVAVRVAVVVRSVVLGLVMSPDEAASEEAGSVAVVVGLVVAVAAPSTRELWSVNVKPALAAPPPGRSVRGERWRSLRKLAVIVC